jgi:hypothetical protein
MNLYHRHQQPEDLVYWNQYRFLPIGALYLEMDNRWLEIAGWSDFDIQDGYRLDAPQAIPSGCQVGTQHFRGDGFFGIANVDREWEVRDLIQEAIDEFLAEQAAEGKVIAHEKELT